jgi:hypothetical protein
MVKSLIRTEFDANKFLLMVWLALNCVFFLFLGVRGSPVYAYMGLSIVNFWIMITVCASIAGHEKRVRLYAELPVTARQAFIAGWAFVLIWMAMQTLAWMLYGWIFEEEFDAMRAGQVLTFGLGSVAFIVVISIGIDLGSFRPRYLQWIYIVVMAALLAGAILNDISVGVLGSESGIRFYPIALLDNLQLEIQASIVVVFVLLLANYLVFRNSDSYLH